MTTVLDEVSAFTPISASNADRAISTSTLLVGRQPILDRRQQIFGYELLFRSGLDDRFVGDKDDSDKATRQMIENVLLLGLDTVAPHGKVFVNCTHEALIGRLVTFLPAESTVLEVLETMEIDEEVIAACIDLKKMGYQIALDDFVPGQAIDRLIEVADYIKLDFRACDVQQLRQTRRYLEGANISLIAEKIETSEEFQRAITDGYHYFQGYFFCRPSIIHGREIPPNQALYIQLLIELSRSSTDLGEIERLVMAEASLCYRVLRLVNSAGLGICGQTTSIRQALFLIGEDQFRKLVAVASATSFGKTFNRSPELILLALQRARFCELLAPVAKQLPGEQYLIGLLSAFDAILQIPMEQLLKMLPLRGEAAGVLRGDDGPVATPLRLLRCYEQRQWEHCAALCETLQLSEVKLTGIYVTSLQWATKEIRDAGL
jgi:EAL and modified HD-GYP domain-containing signal transduction protein